MTQRDGSQPREEVKFEIRDAAIFDPAVIADDRTRLDALQSYFFPRLEFWVKSLVEQVRLIYEIDPLDGMTFAHRPAHRKDSAVVKDMGEVYLGITPGRGKASLKVFHEDGKPFKFSPSYLVISVDPAGALQVCFLPYYYSVDEDFRRLLHGAVGECWDILGSVMEMARIAPQGCELWTPLRESLLQPCRWYSPSLHFPLSESHGLGATILPFLALFPLLDTSARLADGRRTRLRTLVERFRTRFEAKAERDAEDAPDLLAGDDESTDDPEAREVDLPDLDSYQTIRHGRWYQVLARDRFTCQICARSGPKHHVVLHVDHIKARSKGGTDDPSNLRALCEKCNIGKSDKDEPSALR